MIIPACTKTTASSRQMQTASRGRSRAATAEGAMLHAQRAHTRATPKAHAMWRARHQVLCRPPQHLAKISTISGPRSGPVDSVENLNSKLAKPSRNLGRKAKHTKTVASLCGKSWNWSFHNGNLDNPKNQGRPTENRQENQNHEKLQGNGSGTVEPKLKKAQEGANHQKWQEPSGPHKASQICRTCTKNGNQKTNRCEK